MAFRGYVRAQPDWRRVSFPAAPWLEWGAVGGTTAGELFQVAYTVTRPEVVSAKLVLADGREIPLTVFPDRLEAVLPADAADGWAQVVAELADGQVTDSATLDVLIRGLPQGPPIPRPSPAGGLPVRRQRHIISPARVGVRVGPEAVSRREVAQTAVVRVGAGLQNVRAAPQFRARASSIDVHVVIDRGVVRAAVRGGVVVVREQAGATIVKRRDGAEIEEALLLGLL